MDLIDRDALKAAYLAAHKGEPGEAYRLICEAPSVNQWISAEERLPKCCEPVIVCTKYVRGECIEIYDIMAAHTEKDEQGNIEWIDGNCDLIQEEVVAWTQLPEPPVGWPC